MNPKVKPFAGEAFTMRFIPAREDVDTYATLTPYPERRQPAVGGASSGSARARCIVIDSDRDPRAASAGATCCPPAYDPGRRGHGRPTAPSATARRSRPMDSRPTPRDVVASTRLSYHHVADLNVPIACAGVAVYPGDILVGDGDGVTVIPRRLAPRRWPTSARGGTVREVPGLPRARRRGRCTASIRRPTRPEPTTSLADGRRAAGRRPAHPRRSEADDR